MLALLAVSLLIALPIFWAVGVCHRLANLRNNFKSNFSQLDIQLRRRHDLVPNLVEITNSYLTHERDALELLVAKRNHAMTAAGNAAKDPCDIASVQQMATEEIALSEMLSDLLKLSDTHPELKTDGNFIVIIDELTATENRIAFARQAYNDSVAGYNLALQQFPGSLIAIVTGFRSGAATLRI